MRVERTYSGVQTPTKKSVMNYFNLRIISGKADRSAKQHPSNSAHLICAGFVDTFLPILHSY
jgi:hypothetical protein